MTPANSTDAGIGLLIVEDNNALRQMLGWELSDLGYRVIEAGTCAEARDRVRNQVKDRVSNGNSQGPICFALIDLNLPDGSGIDLAKELLQGQQVLRAMLISGSHGARTAIDSDLQAALLGFLPKPINVQQVDRLFRASPASEHRHTP